MLSGNSKLNVVHNSKLNVGIIDSNFHSEDSNFANTHQLLYVSASFKCRVNYDSMRRKSVVLFCFENRVFICLGESIHRQLSRSAGQRTRTHTKCGTLVLFCCDAATQLALQLHQERIQVCAVSGNRLILKVGLTKSLVSTVYQDYSLTSVRSQFDSKVP